ncbi:peroxidase 10-like isoform X2 [Argentina anserina]|uniref:peroxidase 10-like isoform X2 n=1 Tax=Argentina anserina TaxID=57926 RepID=UPI00217668C9|nr:peroxidase 10-like isoform X2 [Potentilla anserina]
MEFNITYKLSYVALICLLFLSPPFVSSQLNYKFYDSSCPNLSKIVQQGVRSAIANDSRIAASLLRLHFHDCFVNGCDASILLDDSSTLKGEKNALPNKDSARGYEVIDNIKLALEEACPCTVSCTDILTLAAASAVYFSGGPYWPVPLGRRDGLTASIDAANNDMPSPFESLDNIAAKFTAKGLDLKDVVVLSGAHTIGLAQCFTFKTRLFNFSESGKPDPVLDRSLLIKLQRVCPNQADSDTTLSPLDPVTSTKFDNIYFKRLVNKSGLLQSDQLLMGDNRTAPMVISYSRFPNLFNKDFRESMVKMANIGVLTGRTGQIRRNCRVVN